VRTDAEKARAELILQQMGRMGYDAAAVGGLDLDLGIETLRSLAARSGVKLLAANALGADGRPVFGERVRTRVGKVEVGVFAVVAGEEWERAGLKTTDAADAARTQAEVLRREGAAFVVGLVHMPYGVAQDLARRVGATQGLVDVVVQAHDTGYMQPTRLGTTWVLQSGERAKVLGRAAFGLAGDGAILDISDRLRAQSEIGYAEEAERQARESLKLEKDSARREVFGNRVADMTKQLKAAKARADAKPPRGSRWLEAEFFQLDDKVKDEPGTKAAVDGYIARFGTTVTPH